LLPRRSGGGDPQHRTRLSEPGRFVALDSLRGIAAVGVVLYHLGDFGWLAGLEVFRSGWLLVDFFFVLSGFVIAASYGDRLAGGYSRGRFLWLRLARVYPLHLAIVGLFVLAEIAVFRPVLHELHDPWLLIRGLFLLDAFATGAGNFYAPVSWSIAVEMVLYLLAAWLFGRGRAGLAIGAGLAVLAAAALIGEFNVTGFGRLIQRGLLGFALGVGAFALHRRLPPLDARILTVAEAGLLAGIAALLTWPGKSAAWIPATDALFFAAVLVFARDAGVFSRILHARPLTLLGQWSYSIYMVHLIYVIALNRGMPPVLQALGLGEWIVPGQHRFGLENLALPAPLSLVLTVVILALSVGTATLTWRWVEEPARLWSRSVRQGGARVPRLPA